MLPEFKIHQPILFGIFLTFATIKVVGEPKQQNLISTKKFMKRTGCLQPSNSLIANHQKLSQQILFTKIPRSFHDLGSRPYYLIL